MASESDPERHTNQSWMKPVHRFDDQTARIELTQGYAALVDQAKSDHSEIGHSRHELRATAVSFSETGTTPIHRIAQKNLPGPPKWSSTPPPPNKPVSEPSCAVPAVPIGGLFTSCFY